MDVSPLIVALDFNDQKQALTLVDALNPRQCALKVGSELFTAWGPAFVRQLIQRQFRVFLDLKFHDIPTTVAKACTAAAHLGVWMMNVHALGGVDMMRAAKKALEPFGTDKPLLIAVTVLTSFKDSELITIGIRHSLLDQVTKLASLAKTAELDGVVCSAYEVAAIKKTCGKPFICVTPGIRLHHNLADDQSRIMTPVQAIHEGCDYLVMGRPITQDPNPAGVVRDILRDIA